MKLGMNIMTLWATPPLYFVSLKQ